MFGYEILKNGEENKKLVTSLSEKKTLKENMKQFLTKLRISPKEKLECSVCWE